jgi:hypothetical protein
MTLMLYALKGNIAHVCLVASNVPIAYTANFLVLDSKKSATLTMKLIVRLYYRQFSHPLE